jgi:hypothetical protein
MFYIIVIQFFIFCYNCLCFLELTSLKHKFRYETIYRFNFYLSFFSNLWTKLAVTKYLISEDLRNILKEIIIFSMLFFPRCTCEISKTVHLILTICQTSSFALTIWKFSVVLLVIELEISFHQVGFKLTECLCICFPQYDSTYTVKQNIKIWTIWDHIFTLLSNRLNSGK